MKNIAKVADLAKRMDGHELDSDDAVDSVDISDLSSSDFFDNFPEGTAKFSDGQVVSLDMTRYSAGTYTQYSVTQSEDGSTRTYSQSSKHRFDRKPSVWTTTLEVASGRILSDQKPGLGCG